MKVQPNLFNFKRFIIFIYFYFFPKLALKYTLPYYLLILLPKVKLGYLNLLFISYCMDCMNILLPNIIIKVNKNKKETRAKQNSRRLYELGLDVLHKYKNFINFLNWFIIITYFEDILFIFYVLW